MSLELLQVFPRKIGNYKIRENNYFGKIELSECLQNSYICTCKSRGYNGYLGKKKRSDVMAKIRSKDTKPEWIVRRYLYSRGYRYRKNVKGLPGTPDIVLRKYGIVIFIHGCFWHGHEVDGHIPHSNVDFWRKKIERNKQRDEHNKEALKKWVGKS